MDLFAAGTDWMQSLKQITLIKEETKWNMCTSRRKIFRLF